MYLLYLANNLRVTEAIQVVVLKISSELQSYTPYVGVHQPIHRTWVILLLEKNEVDNYPENIKWGRA